MNNSREDAKDVSFFASICVTFVGTIIGFIFIGAFFGCYYDILKYTYTKVEICSFEIYNTKDFIKYYGPNNYIKIEDFECEDLKYYYIRAEFKINDKT
jgi:hypothetical protein